METGIFALQQFPTARALVQSPPRAPSSDTQSRAPVTAVSGANRIAKRSIRWDAVEHVLRCEQRSTGRSEYFRFSGFESSSRVTLDRLWQPRLRRD
jgi:hypothetical protein